MHPKWKRKWQPTPVFLLGEIPWTEEPGGLQSMGFQRVGHNWVTEHACTPMFTAMLFTIAKTQKQSKCSRDKWIKKMYCIYRLPRRHSGKESTYLCRKCKRCRFSPWVRKIPWREGTATHPSMLAWNISWTEDPGRLQSMGSQRARNDWLNGHAHRQQILLYGTGSYIQYPGINHSGQEYKKECTRIYNHITLLYCRN